MKKISFIALFLSFICVGQLPEDLFREANGAYNKGEYDRAIQYYDSIRSLGVHSVELYYNLGNAHYKRNAVAPSILNYEKALLLDPHNEQVLNNLAFANNMTLDRFTPLPESDLKKHINSLLSFTSVQGWSLGTVVFFWLAALLLFLYLNTRISIHKRLYFTAFLLALVVSILTLIFAIQQRNVQRNTRPAIVFAPTESFRSEPNLRAEVLLTIHEGTKVLIQEYVEDWVKIKLANGSVGWIPKTSLQPIAFITE